MRALDASESQIKLHGDLGLHFWDALVEILLEALLRELVEYKRIEPHGLRSPCEC